MSAPNNDKYDRDLKSVLRTVRAFADEHYPECDAPEITLILPTKDEPVRLYATRLYSQYLRVWKPTVVTWWASPDFRRIVWHNRKFELSKQQAETVRLLHEARENGNPAVDQGLILRAIGSESTRLSEVFRKGAGHAAWGTLVVQDGDLPGCYRIGAAPTDEPSGA